MSVIQNAIEREQKKITRMSVVMSLVGLLVPKMPLLEGIGTQNTDENGQWFVNDLWRSSLKDKRGNTQYKTQHMSDLYWTVGLSSLLGVGYTNIPMMVKTFQKNLPDDGHDDGNGMQGQKLGNVEFLQQMYLYMERIWRRDEGFDIELPGTVEGLKHGVKTANGTTLWQGIKIKKRHSVLVTTVTDGVSTEGKGWYCTEEIEEVIQFMTQMRMDNVKTRVSPTEYSEFKNGRTMRTRGSTGYLPGNNMSHLKHKPVKVVRPRWLKVIADLSRFDEYGQGEFTQQEIDRWIMTGYCPNTERTIDAFQNSFCVYTEWAIKVADAKYKNRASYAPNVEMSNWAELPANLKTELMDEYNSKVLQWLALSKLVPGEWYTWQVQCDRRGRFSWLGPVSIQQGGVCRTEATFGEKKRLGD
jgi:hypothetical protein